MPAPRVNPPQPPHSRTQGLVQEQENLDALGRTTGRASALYDENRAHIPVYLDRTTLQLYARPENEWVPVGGGGPNANAVYREVQNYFAGGGGGTNPAGQDQSVQYNQVGHFGGDNSLVWDYNNQRLGILGPGAFAVVPGVSLHVERSGAAGQRTLGYFHNTLSDATALAQIVVQSDTANSWAGFAHYGNLYNDPTSGTVFRNKAQVYSSLFASGLTLLALDGMVEVWLYHDAYPASVYQNVANFRSVTDGVGLMPGADSTFLLGSETDVLRWADGSFDQIHLNAHLVTCEGASILGQDYSTDSATVQFAKLGLGAAPSATAGDLLYMYGGGGAAGRTTINLGDSGWAVPSAAGAVSNGDKAIFYNVGSEKYALGLEAGHLWIQGPTKFYVGATGIAEVDNTAFFPLAASIDLGLSGQYFDYAFINRIYLNSTAYFSGATAGAADLYGDLTLATAYKTIKGTAGNTLWRITGKYTDAGAFPSDVVLSNNYFYTDGTIGGAVQSTAMILARCTPDDTVGIIDFMLGIRNTAPTSKLTVGQAVVTVASGIALKLGNARVANADAAITGYVTVQDSAGATYKLAIIN